MVSKEPREILFSDVGHYVFVDIHYVSLSDYHSGVCKKHSVTLSPWLVERH